MILNFTFGLMTVAAFDNSPTPDPAGRLQGASRAVREAMSANSSQELGS
ncbi:hypothetical protein ACFV4G_30230 [Kitasatospora sp. NPDC059747]